MSIHRFMRFALCLLSGLLTLLILGTILGVGLSWSLIRARLTGQVEVQ